jgi:methionyl-tRNA formyltransferase
VYQPSSLKTEETRELFASLAPELIVVVAYGKILPSWLLQSPKYGCINLHGSLLPKYRGAAPVHWAIAHGETKTGVCTMLLDEGLDTGPVYLSEETSIGPDEAARLHCMIGWPSWRSLVRNTIDRIVAGLFGTSRQFASDVRSELEEGRWGLDWFRPAASSQSCEPSIPGRERLRGSRAEMQITKTALFPALGLAKANRVRRGFKGPAHCAVRRWNVANSFIQPESRRPCPADFANGTRAGR